CNLASQAQGLSTKNRALISQNILAYRFRYGQNWELKLQNDRVLKHDYMFFKDLWTSEKDTLYYDVEKANISYPNSQLHLFHIQLSGLIFPTDSLRHGFQFIFFYGQNYLVGVDNATDKLVFLSGDFFLSDYASDFQLDVGKPVSFYNYLYLRYFNMSLHGIK